MRMDWECPIIKILILDQVPLLGYDMGWSQPQFLLIGPISTKILISSRVRFYSYNFKSLLHWAHAWVVIDLQPKYYI